MYLYSVAGFPRPDSFKITIYLDIKKSDFYQIMMLFARQMKVFLKKQLNFGRESISYY